MSIIIIPRINIVLIYLSFSGLRIICLSFPTYWHLVILSLSLSSNSCQVFYSDSFIPTNNIIGLCYQHKCISFYIPCTSRRWILKNATKHTIFWTNSTNYFRQMFNERYNKGLSEQHFFFYLFNIKI